MITDRNVHIDSEPKIHRTENQKKNGKFSITEWFHGS